MKKNICRKTVETPNSSRSLVFQKVALSFVNIVKMTPERTKCLKRVLNSVGEVNIHVDVQEEGSGQSQKPPLEPVFKVGPSQGRKTQFPVIIQPRSF